MHYAIRCAKEIHGSTELIAAFVVKTFQETTTHTHKHTSMMAKNKSYSRPVLRLKASTTINQSKWSLRNSRLARLMRLNSQSRPNTHNSPFRICAIHQLTRSQTVYSRDDTWADSIFIFTSSRTKRMDRRTRAGSRAYRSVCVCVC